MKLAILAVVLQALAFTPVTEAYKVTANGGVNCRSGPGTSYPVKRSYAKGADVTISCQTTGTNVEGNNIWDKTQHGCYVADKYIRTGIDGFVTKKCGSSSGGGNSGSSKGKIPGPRKDDYPYKSSCGGVDPWNYFRCQCTSFVAWRINERHGKKFHNRYKGQAWGNANQWDEAARKSGVKVNNTPKPGCIAQTNAGRYGHVAYVSAVNGDKVTIEEYNYARRERYGTRVVNKSAFQYIHI
ncbi:hypothetical protein VTK26DRAFT_5248 [Humicola hyalothermophila]